MYDSSKNGDEDRGVGANSFTWLDFSEQAETILFMLLPSLSTLPRARISFFFVLCCRTVGNKIEKVT